MTVDVNGQELHKGGLALLLCEILDIEPDTVRIRIMNSDVELGVSVKCDEVLGRVADSELTAFVEAPPAPREKDEHVAGRFE